ncbi:MAG: chromosomal replication initiator protein DnaA [Alphaproteobacteria bacterium]|jgi:chromosomal replication initiator protein
MSVVSLEERRNAEWARIRGRLRAEFGDGVFRSWLRPLTLKAVEDEAITLCVPTRFVRDRVSTLYGDRLKELWRAEDDTIGTIDIHVEPEHAGRKPSLVAAPPQPEVESERDDAWADGVASPLDPKLSFDNFVVGKPNEFAYAACMRAAETEAPAFNPLFLYGGVGLGKTHLMHATASAIRQNFPEKRVLYLTAEKFLYQFIHALRAQETVAFKELFRSVDVLMVDDVQFLCGRDATQEEFFHTFNALVDQGRQVIVSADTSPTDMDGLEERVRSRLGWGLVVELNPTNYELRLSILEAKAVLLGLKLDERVLEFVAQRITTNIRELEGALNRLAAYAQLGGRQITLETAQEALRDLLRASERRVSIEEIQKHVAEHFNIRLADMSSPRRARAVARPRQVAMYLAKHLTSRSLPEIGRKFGGRDHTTVMHAIRKIEELSAADNVLAEDIRLIRRVLEN